jgi:hypothetical protein
MFDPLSNRKGSQSYDFGIYNYKASAVEGWRIFTAGKIILIVKHALLLVALYVNHDRRIGSSAGEKMDKSNLHKNDHVDRIIL